MRSSNINEDTFVMGEDDVFVNRKAINIPFVQNGDILITSANGSLRLVGKHAIIREITDNSAVHGGFMLLATAKNPQFLNAVMGASWYIKFINLFVAGGNGAIGNLSKNDLDEQTILVPYENEQELIGGFFDNLDHLITLHQSKFFGDILKTIASYTLYWEQRKHGEVFIYLRNNTLSREDLNDEDGFAQSIHYGDVLIKYGECLNVSKELLPYIDKKNIVNKFKKFYIQNGDVIIADTAEDETVGKCIEISGIVDHNIISGLHTIPLRPVNNFAHGYLGFYLNSNSYHNQLKPLMQGIKVTSISKNLLKITTLNYPSNIKEQKIIGSYFDSLNHLITLHQLEPFQLIFKAIAYRIIDYAKSKPPRCRKYTGLIEFIKYHI